MLNVFTCRQRQLAQRVVPYRGLPMKTKNVHTTLTQEPRDGIESPARIEITTKHQRRSATADIVKVPKLAEWTAAVSTHQSADTAAANRTTAIAATCTLSATALMPVDTDIASKHRVHFLGYRHF